MRHKYLKCVVMTVIALVLLGCQSSNEKLAVTEFEGFIGFKQNKPWAITFNDCTVYRFAEAKVYYWFDRNLDKLSCYKFSEADKTALLGFFNKVYQMPSLTAPSKGFIRFEQLNVSSSGWGTFPKVFARQGANWFLVQEGWIYLQDADFELVEIYQGLQDMSLKATHDSYYKNH